MLTPMHVTASGGLNVYFGNDIVDGQPIGPVHLVQGQTFYLDQQATDFQHLYRIANSASYTTGAGSVPITPGTQTAIFRQNSGIPGQESE